MVLSCCAPGHLSITNLAELGGTSVYEDDFLLNRLRLDLINGEIVSRPRSRKSMDDLT